MAFINTSLPNKGQTAHYVISYDDSLAQTDLSLARGLFDHCEQDFALMSSWFPGVNFRFAFPISVQITPATPSFTGASWEDPPDSALPYFHPNVEIDFPPGASIGEVRFLLVAEVVEMFMASASLSGKGWYEPTSFFSGGDEGSMGESLSRFLSAQFLLATGISPVLFAGSSVVPFWLNDPGRPGFDFVDFAPDDNQPDAITGCGTCFLFFLHDQLKFSIQQIIAAASSSLAGVYTNLTGKTDAWTAFHTLVDSHYPLGGPLYLPPLDDIFPVADLQIFSAPKEASWVQNGNPNFAWLFFNHPLPVGVTVTLSSDRPAILQVPATVNMSSFAQIPLIVPAQGPNFADTAVTLSATYAGVTLKASVMVVNPENLTLASLEIVPIPGDNPCALLFVEGSSQQFEVKSLSVFADQTGLTYNWKVSGAQAAMTTDPVLTIPHLPARGKKVTVSVDVTNASNIRAKGKYTFVVSQQAKGKGEQFRQLDCSLRNLRAINLNIPPWVPNQAGEVELTAKQLASIRDQAQRFAVAAKRVIAMVNAISTIENIADERLADRASTGARLRRVRAS